MRVSRFQGEKSGSELGFFGALHEKLKDVVPKRAFKSFQNFKRSKEREHQAAAVFDDQFVRGGVLTDALSPTPLARSTTPSIGNRPPPSHRRLSSRAYVCAEEEEDGRMGPSRCSTMVPPSASPSPDLMDSARTSTMTTPDLYGSEISPVPSRPGTRQGMRDADDIMRTLDIERSIVGDDKFLDIVLCEKMKQQYWDDYTNAGISKKVISDFEDHMRKVYQDIGDEDIVASDLKNCDKGFTTRTPREQLVFSYARQCYETYSLPLGPRHRGGVRKDTSAAQLAAPDMLLYGGWSLGSDRLDMLCEASGSGMAGCRHVDLSGNRIEDRSVPKLCRQLLRTVETVNLSKNLLTHRGARLLSDGFKSVRSRLPLLELNLEENSLGEAFEQDVCSFVDSLGALCPQLRGLSLAKNGLGNVDGALGRALGHFVGHAPKLKVLDLHWNNFGGVGAYHLLMGIYENGQQSEGKKLSRVDLSWNRLGWVDESHKNAVPAKVLGDVLEDHQGLFHLDISYNQLGVQACQAIADGIRNNRTLLGFHIAGNAAAIDAHGFVVPHENPSSIDPPLINSDTLSFLDFSGTGQHRGSLGGVPPPPTPGPGQRPGVPPSPSPGPMSKQSIRYASGGGAEHHAVGLMANIGNHSLDGLTLRAERCWICDRWRPVPLVWTSQPEQELQSVRVYLSIDNFRRPMPLERMPKAASSSRETWEGHVMLPPRGDDPPFLVIFQVDGQFERSRDLPARQLDQTVYIQHTCGESSTYIPGQLSQEIDPHDGKHIAVDYANEVPLAAIGENLFDRAQCASAQPLVVTEDHVEHGKLLVAPRSVTASVEKTEHRWNIVVSVWSSWAAEDDVLLEKMLDFDMSLSKIPKMIGTLPDSAMKQAIMPYYAKAMTAYRLLAVTAGSQIFGLSLTNLVTLGNRCDIFDDDMTVNKFSNCAISAGAVDKKNARVIRVRADGVTIRYQFLETVVRAAQFKYLETSRAGDICEATAMMLQELEEYFGEMRRDVEDFRKSFFVEEVDMVFKAYLHVLHAVYDIYVGLHSRPNAMEEMSMRAWLEFLKDCDAFDERFTGRKAPQAFVYGLMFQIDEVSTERHMHMNFVEFLVAIGAVIYMRQFWREEEFADLMEEFFEDTIMHLVEERGTAEQKEVLKSQKAGDGAGRPVAISKTELRKAFEIVFKIADEDDDGTLTLREFRNAFRNPKVQAVLGGQSMRVEDFIKIFDSLDDDGNHVLTVEEAIQGFGAIRRLEVTADRAYAFLTNLCKSVASPVDGVVRRDDLLDTLMRLVTQRKLLRLSLDPANVVKYLTEQEQNTFEVEELVPKIMELRAGKPIPKWKIVLKQVFQEADEDCSGSVSKGEWRTCMDSASTIRKFEQCGLSKGIIDGLFDQLDTDGSNDLTEAELTEGFDALIAAGHAKTEEEIELEKRKAARSAAAKDKRGSVKEGKQSRKEKHKQKQQEMQAKANAKKLLDERRASQNPDQNPDQEEDKNRSNSLDAGSPEEAADLVPDMVSPKSPAGKKRQSASNKRKSQMASGEAEAAAGNGKRPTPRRASSGKDA